MPAGRASGVRPGGARAFKPSQRVSAIDVVHKDFFDDWVKRHVEVYAQKFATVALRHQTEIATGSGYVTGMGVNSWTGEKRPDGVMPLDASSCSKAAAVSSGRGRRRRRYRALRSRLSCRGRQLRRLRELAHLSRLHCSVRQARAVAMDTRRRDQRDSDYSGNYRIDTHRCSPRAANPQQERECSASVPCTDQTRR